MEINGKAAIVTGGTKGIGYKIAERLVKTGAAVFICGRSKTELRDAIGSLSASGKVGGEVCDVRSEDQVKMMIDECVRLFGGVDVLVNNAGVGYFGETVEKLSGE